MRPVLSAGKLNSNQKRFGCSADRPARRSICRTVVILGFVICFFYFSLSIYSDWKRLRVMSKSCDPNPIRPESPTNISHVVFGLIGSVEGWRHRRPFIESWWRPNITRGYLFLDAAPPDDLLPWPSSSPRFRVSEDTSVQILQYTGHDATMVRIARGILETFREGDEGVRWIVMGDDDSIFFTENLVEVLGRYDHNEYVYIGGHSESLSSNFVHSFDMGFGGAGVIFSYALAKALVPWLDECIKRYPSVIAADQMWQSCLADMGVYLTPHKGIHQIDLHGDISGLLSAHPQTPLLSLHHPEKVNAIFPSMDRHQSVNHLMKAASVDQSRLLQQTICYHRPSNWSLSISWGYSAHIYDQLYPKSVLQKPLQTFLPWRRNARPPLFRFNTRIPSKDPCDAPHVFYFWSVNNSTDTGQILTTYIRPRSRRLPPDCSFNGGHSPAHISEIRVFSPLIKLSPANQRECCDLLVSEDKNTAEVKYRACMKDEVIA